MALQRIDSTAQVGQAGGYTQVRLGLDSAMEAQQWAQAGQTAATAFDIVKREYDQDAVRQAQIDAPAAIKKDGSGALIPVSDFEAPGGYFQSAAYKNAYRDSGYSTYSASAQQDFQKSANDIVARFPNDLIGAKRALDEKRNAIVSGLDPRFAPLLSLQLNAISGQAETRVNANVVDEGHKIAAVNAQWGYDGIIAKIAAAGHFTGDTDPEALKANNALLRADIERTQIDMDKAGWSKERQSHLWSKLAVKANIAVAVRDIRDTVFTMKNDGGTDRDAKILEMHERINRTADSMGADGAAYKAAASQALNEALGKDALRASQFERTAIAEDQRTALDVDMRAAQRRPVYSDPGSPGGDPLETIRAERAGVYIDPNISDAQRIRRLGIYDKAIGDYTGELQTYATQRAASMIGEMQVTPDPQRSRALLHDLMLMSSNPNPTLLPVNTKVAIDRAISNVAADEFRSDFATTAAVSAQGKLHPDDLEGWGKRNQNRIGTAPNSLLRPEQWFELVNSNREAWGKRQQLDALIKQGAGMAARGETPPPEVQKAMDTSRELRPEYGAPYEIRNEDHRRIADSGLFNNMNVDEAVKGQIKMAVSSADPKTIESAAAQVESFRSVLINSKKFSQEGAEAWLRENLGDKAMETLPVYKSMQHNDWLKHVRNKSHQSQSQNLGTNPNSAANTIEKELEPTMRNMVNESTMTAWDQLKPVRPLTPRQVETRSLLGDKAPGLATSLLGPLRNALPPGSLSSVEALVGGQKFAYSKLSLNDQVKAIVMPAAMAILAEGGERMDAANPGINNKEVAIRQAMMRHMPHLELTTDPKDSSHGIYQLKSANKELGAKSPLGRDLSKQEARGVATALYNTHVQFTREFTGQETMEPDIDPGTIHFRSWVSPNGTHSFKIIANMRSSTQEVELMSLAKNDPRISAFFMDLQTKAQKDFETWRGRGKDVPDEFSAAWMGAKVAAGVQAMVGGFYSGPMKAANIEEQLKSAGYDPSDRSYLGEVWDSMFGKDMADPKNRPYMNVDLAEMRKVYVKSKNEEELAKARSLMHLLQVKDRARWGTAGVPPMRPELPPSPPLAPAPGPEPEPPPLQIEKMRGLRPR